MKKEILSVLRRANGTNVLKQEIEKLNENIANLNNKFDFLIKLCGNNYDMLANYLPQLQTLNFRDYNAQSLSGYGKLKILCDKYGSDKASIFSKDPVHTYSWISHTYADIYDMIFAPIKKDVKYLFECGIGTNNPLIPSNMSINGRPGASLFVWREYFRQSIR